MLDSPHACIACCEIRLLREPERERPVIDIALRIAVILAGCILVDREADLSVRDGLLVLQIRDRDALVLCLGDDVPERLLVASDLSGDVSIRLRSRNV